MDRPVWSSFVGQELLEWIAKQKRTTRYIAISIIMHIFTNVSIYTTRLIILMKVFFFYLWAYSWWSSQMITFSLPRYVDMIAYITLLLLFFWWWSGFEPRTLHILYIVPTNWLKLNSRWHIITIITSEHNHISFCNLCYYKKKKIVLWL